MRLDSGGCERAANSVFGVPENRNNPPRMRARTMAAGGLLLLASAAGVAWRLRAWLRVGAKLLAGGRRTDDLG